MKFENIMTYFGMIAGIIILVQTRHSPPSFSSGLSMITGILMLTASIYYRWFE